MNTHNNKRKKASQNKIEKVFLELIQTKELSQISVTDICNKAQLNRTTFYSNYLDVYDLADKIRTKMIIDFLEVYKEEQTSKKHSYNFLKLFQHINENQIFYKTYFKLNFDLIDNDFLVDENEFIKFYGTTKNKDYHIIFFKAGITAIIKKWLYNGCKETPEEIYNIINSEYRKRID